MLTRSIAPFPFRSIDKLIRNTLKEELRVQNIGTAYTHMCCNRILVRCEDTCLEGEASILKIADILSCEGIGTA